MSSEWQPEDNNDKKPAAEQLPWMYGDYNKLSLQEEEAGKPIYPLYVQMSFFLFGEDPANAYTIPDDETYDTAQYLFPVLILDTKGYDKYFMCRFNFEKAGIPDTKQTHALAKFIFSTICLAQINDPENENIDDINIALDTIWEYALDYCQGLAESYDKPREQWQGPSDTLNEAELTETYAKIIDTIMETSKSITPVKRTAMIGTLNAKDKKLIRKFHSTGYYGRAEFARDYFLEAICDGEETYNFGALPFKPPVRGSNKQNGG